MKIFLVSLGVLLSLAASAQLKGFGVGPYVETGWPAGTFVNTHNRGWGGGIGADIKLPGRLGITGSAGYMRFGARDIETDNKAIQAFPVRVGLKYRLPFVYLKLESGKSNMTGGQGGWIFAPGIGVRVLGVDLQAKYETWTGERRVSFWGLKGGFQF